MMKMKEKDKEQENFTAEFKIPDTKSVVDNLRQELQKAHKIEMKNVKEKYKPQIDTICCCGDKRCSIGPFTEIQR